MQRLAIVLAPALAGALAVAPLAVRADEPSAGNALIEEGAKLLLRGMLKEMGPQMDQILQLQDLARKIGDPSNYQMPEVLPNGDILIRRKPGAPPRADLPEGGKVDL
jgi:hypothetical protein